MGGFAKDKLSLLGQTKLDTSASADTLQENK
jgi:hypothetical protein